MDHRLCPKCHKEIQPQSGAAFCPFCGAALALTSPNGEEPQAVTQLLQQTAHMTDPRKKHELLQQALAQYPDSLALNQALLYLGRLYERGGKDVDFSVIKCFLLKPYLDPEEFSHQRKAELYQELFSHPLLEKCLALAGDRDGFMRAYLLHLSEAFISLFLRGDSRYMRRFLGFGLEGRAAKLLAGPAAYMLNTMRKDAFLTPPQRDMLMQQFYQAFSREMGGDTSFLDQQLHQAGMSLPGHTTP